jgi:hypothetical protein
MLSPNQLLVIFRCLRFGAFRDVGRLRSGEDQGRDGIVSEPLTLFVLGSTLFATSYVLQRLLKGAVRFFNCRPKGDQRQQGQPNQVGESTLAGS